jgi:hypothetical protein
MLFNQEGCKAANIMRNSQKLEMERLLAKANRYNKKYYIDHDSQGHKLMSNRERISPIMKPTAFIDWLDAFTMGQEVVFETFGIPLVEVTNGMRDNQLSSSEALANADENIIENVSSAVSVARAVYYNHYA